LRRKTGVQSRQSGVENKRGGRQGGRRSSNRTMKMVSRRELPSNDGSGPSAKRKKMGELRKKKLSGRKRPRHNYLSLSGKYDKWESRTLMLRRLMDTRRGGAEVMPCGCLENHKKGGKAGGGTRKKKEGVKTHLKSWQVKGAGDR